MRLSASCCASAVQGTWAAGTVGISGAKPEIDEMIAQAGIAELIA